MGNKKKKKKKILDFSSSNLLKKDKDQEDKDKDQDKDKDKEDQDKQNEKEDHESIKELISYKVSSPSEWEVFSNLLGLGPFSYVGIFLSLFFLICNQVFGVGL